MKVPNQRGSFGVPQEIKEQMEKAKAKHIEKEEDETEKVPEGWPMDGAEPPAEERPESAVDPYAILKSIGIETSEEDFHNLIFRGYVEKTVNIAKNPINKQMLTAKIKTLTAEELDMVDELVAEGIDKSKMTNAGLDTRRSMWVMSFAVLELNGKPVAKNVMVDKEFDAKATAMVRRSVIAKLSPFIIDKIIRIHAQMGSCYNFIVTDSESEVVKKS